MHAVFADPKTDFVFKRIFGAESRKPLLVALLNNLLELDGDRRILDVQHLTGEQHVDIAELKLSIVDVKCTDATGRRFVVEMQVLKVEGFEKRVVYNARACPQLTPVATAPHCIAALRCRLSTGQQPVFESSPCAARTAKRWLGPQLRTRPRKAYVMQLRNAEEYPALCDVFGVTICNFNLWPDRDAHGRFKVPMLSRWRMQEQHSGERGLPQVQYAFLELPKYEAGDAPTTLIEKWAYFFREAKNLNVVPPSLSEEPFRDALEIARTTSFTAEEWEVYERAKMAEQDARGALTIARQEGKLEGKREALLLLLAHRGIALVGEDRARIVACEDGALLEGWFQRALTAASTVEVFA